MNLRFRQVALVPVVVWFALTVLHPTRISGRDFSGATDGELTVSEGDIGIVDGKGNRILVGQGQNLRIREKNGDGSLTLRGFGQITIGSKNGLGTLFIAEDNAAVSIAALDGPGQTYLRNAGSKKIKSKNGPGNVYFHGLAPEVEQIEGAGKFIREN